MTDDLDQLKRHPSVLDIYRSRMNLKRFGKGMRGNCPFHSDSTPSLDVWDDGGTLIFKCLGCGEAGSVLDFVAKFDKLSLSAAIKKVKDEIGNSWQQQKTRVEATFKPFAEEEKQVKTLSFEQYKPLEDALASNQAAQKWLREERGLELSVCRRLRLGYRQDIGSIGGAALADVRDGGWIAFPRITGDCVGAVHYRSIRRKAFARQPGMGTYLFNLPTIDLLEPLYVTEGEFDAVVLEQAGFRAVSVPNATTNLTPEQKDQLLEASCVILAGDSDEAGTKFMEKLWAELQERTFMLRWPDGAKDASDLWNKCKRDLSSFRTRVEELTLAAKSQPIPNVYSLAESMIASDRTNLTDHPDRLKLPWPSVDRMAVLLPGSVMSLFASTTGTGKTMFIAQLTLEAARRGEVVMNYQCELNTSEFANLAAANILRKNRNTLTAEDYKAASKCLQGVKYYIGRNPTLTTVQPVLDLIEAAVRRLSASIVVLDHIHFLTVNDKDEIQAQAAAMQRLKNMAVKYNCKVIVAGQPRKANAQQKGKVVHISDAKGSEAFTSDADVVIALHRNTLKNVDPENPPRDMLDPITEVHLQKARAKGEGSAFARLMCIGELASFAEIAPDAPPDLFGK